MKLKKVHFIILFIICISLFCGSIFFIRNNNKINEKESESKTIINENEKRIDEINKRLVEISTESNEEFKKNGFSKKYNELSSEQSSLYKKKNELSSENFSLKNKHYSKVSSYIIGGLIIFIGIGISGFIYFIYEVSHAKYDFKINEFKDEDKDKEISNSEYVSLKCPNCGNTNLKGLNEEKCEYCGSLLVKTKK